MEMIQGPGQGTKRSKMTVDEIHTEPATSKDNSQGRARLPDFFLKLYCPQQYLGWVSGEMSSSSICPERGTKAVCEGSESHRKIQIVDKRLGEEALHGGLDALAVPVRDEEAGAD